MGCLPMVYVVLCKARHLGGLCVYVCAHVCVRERERERERVSCSTMYLLVS